MKLIDREMTESEIMKALKECEDCHCFNECEKSTRLALDLINRKNAEIEALREYYNEVCKYGENRSNGLYCTGEKCLQFKPNSRFVELPCEVGQTVWLKMYGVITEGTIIMIDLNYYTNPQVWLSVEYISPITGNKNEYKSRVDLMLGKTVFLSREDAENALAERSK